MSIPLLRVKNLHVRFKRAHAVRGISFDVFEGETLGIVGESGCGKSASIKSLIKLLPDHTTQIQGEAHFNGKDLIAMSEKEMQSIRGKEIGMIFQDPMTSLNPTLSIGLQISEGYRHHHPEATRAQADLKAIDLLKKVGLSDPETRLTEYPHTLSGGMRQRAMIALALASHPKLLLADEPTTALDVTIQAQILILLKQLQKTLEMTTVLITHDLNVIASICDRVIIMYGGHIVEWGTVDEVLKDPKHPYTRQLLNAIPRLDHPKSHRLIPIEGSPPDLSKSDSGCPFAPRCLSALETCHHKEPPLQPRTKCWLP